MKNNGKIPLILQVIIMYIVCIFCFVIAFTIEEEMQNSLILTMYLLYGLCFVAGFVNILVAILHIFLKSESSTMVTIIVKLSLIPWYILNFLFWLIAFVIMINPWFLPFAPVVLVVGVVSTYFLMICTGAHNLSYVIKLVKNKEATLTIQLVISIVFHFIFVLDIVGSFVLHSYLKKIENKNTSKVIEEI